MTRLSPRWITDCGSSHDLFNHSVNWKPVIAASHGYVMELAVEIVLECDLVVAEEGTQFQITETSRGLGAAKAVAAQRRAQNRLQAGWPPGRGVCGWVGGRQAGAK